MKKENWLSLILPAVNFLFAGSFFVLCAVSGIPPLALLAYMIGCIVAVYLIVSYKLNVGKHMPVYILMAIVAFAAQFLVYKFDENLLITMGVPVAVAVITFLVFSRRKYGREEMLVMILTSPIIYFAVSDVIWSLVRLCIHV